MYLQNLFTNHIFNIHVRTGFGIELPTMVYMQSNQTKTKLGQIKDNLYSSAEQKSSENYLIAKAHSDIHTWTDAHTSKLDQLAGAVEYTNCISAEGKDSPNKFPGYDTKQSDVEAPVMLELSGMRSILLLTSL